jgi:hypothetical protein
MWLQKMNLLNILQRPQQSQQQFPDTRHRHLHQQQLNSQLHKMARLEKSMPFRCNTPLQPMLCCTPVAQQ